MSQEDGARFSPQPTRNKSCCSVNGCFSKASRDFTVRFHTYPKIDTDFVSITNKSGVLEKISRRDVWVQRLMMDKAITENTRVCSLHFKRSDYILPDAPTQKRYLKRDAVPSCNLPLAGSEPIPETAMLDKANEDPRERCAANNANDFSEPEIKLEKKAGRCKNQSDDRSELDRTAIKEEPQEPEIKLEPLDEELDELHLYGDQDESLTEKRTGSNCLTIKEEPQGIETKFESVDLPDIDPNSHFQQLWDIKKTNFRDAATQTDEQLSGLRFTDIIKSNRDLNILTGIPNFSVLNTIVDVLKVASPRLAKAKGLTLNIADRIIMTFMKLKQDLTYEALGAFFECKSKRSCKRIILQTLDTLGCGLKFAIHWPGRHEASGNSPNFSYDLSNIRCVINRIEIAVRRSKEPFRRVSTFSSSKRYHSVKFMTAVTPAGFICFLSRAYGGRTSHRTLFEESNIIKFLERNDTLMALKDFPIDDICKEHNISLVKSLYSRNIENAQNPTDYRALLNVNQRFRRFRIFRRKLTTTLSLKTEEILTILCAVENLSSRTWAITNSKRS